MAWEHRAVTAKGGKSPRPRWPYGEKLLSARFCAPRRGGCQRIGGPRGLGIAATHLALPLGLGTAPEGGQVLRGLDRAPCRREQRKRERRAARCHRGMPVQAEELLHANGKHRALLRRIIDQVPADGRVEIHRRFLIESARKIARKKSVQAAREVIGGNFRERSFRKKR